MTATPDSVTIVVTMVIVAGAFGATVMPALAGPADARPDPGEQLVALFDLGTGHREAGRHESALEALREMLALAETTGNRRAIGSASFNIGEILQETGRYYEAIGAFTEAAQMAGMLGATAQEGAANCQLGVAHYLLARNEPALPYFHKCYELARRAQQPIDALQALNGAGSVHYRLGQTGPAERYYRDAVELAALIDDPVRQARGLANLALTQADQGRLDEAHETLRTGVEIAGRADAPAELARAWLNLGTVEERRGDTQAARQAYQNSVHQFAAAADARGEGLAHQALGELYANKENHDMAVTHLRLALERYETVRAGVIAADAFNVDQFEFHQRSYLLLQRALVASGRHGEALVAAEMGRARAFADLLRGGARSTLTSPAPAGRDDMVELVTRARVTALVFSVVPDARAIYIWTLQPDGRIRFAQTPLDDLDLAALVAGARARIGAAGRGLQPVPDDAAGPDPLHELYRRLIRPVETYLPASPEDVVLVLPHAELNLVPFAALVDDGGRELLERHTFAFAPSFESLRLLGDRPGAEGAPLIVGNPVMPRPGPDQPRLPPLPGTEREARAIGALLDTAPLIGADATEMAVRARMGAARVIHLATHGLLDNPGDTGVPGAIVLTPTGGADGFLGAAEIAATRIGAEMVVLSACDTGRGRLTGDGVVGLGRAFLGAGARNVVVSLWSVPDMPTEILMVAFYEQLELGLNPARALRHAMLQVRATAPAAINWAGFQVMGPPSAGEAE